MRNVHRKTNKEIERDRDFGLIKEVTVNDTKKFYWACDQCSIAYLGEDIILKKESRNNSTELCPNLIKKSFFGKPVRCLNPMVCGDERCFKEYYEIIE